MFYRYTGAMLFTFMIATCCVGQQPGLLPGYFPMSIGSKWTYSISDQKADLVVSAVRTEKVKDITCTVLETTIDGKIVATEHVAIVGDSVQRFRLSNVDITPPLSFTKLQLKEGDKWDSEFNLVLDKKDVKSDIGFSVHRQQVKVPAGKYEALQVVGKMKTSLTSVWYVQEVGPVKMVFDLGSDRLVTLELKEYEIKK